MEKLNILVTGAKGFVGKNLCRTLETIRDEKNRARNIRIGEIFEYDTENTISELDDFCAKADFVFNFAGANRPKDQREFMKGNRDFVAELLSMLKKNGNTCPVVFSSSIQASLVGRYAESEYGRSKLEGEKLAFEHGKETGARVLVYRFPNLFGKWCRPNYNSAVATFCHNIANGVDITVSDPNIELELLYVDDLVDEMLNALEGCAHRCSYDGLEVVSEENGDFCYVPGAHRVALGKIVEHLRNFENQPGTLVMPEMPEGSFEKKLYSTYLSYLPKEKTSFVLKMNKDERGSFTELMKTENCGQFSVNVSLPGITKGEHWHHSKWEFFMVVSGHGLIQMRNLDSGEIREFEVSGEKIEAVHMLPGYTHNVVNLSESENLVTVMWANEKFDPEKPDTYSEKVIRER